MDAEEITRAEALLARVRTNRAWVHLPAELQVLYRVRRNAGGRGQLLVAVLFGIAFFDCFLLSDADLVPDVAALSAWTRIGLITPLGLLYVPLSRWALRRDPGTRVHHVYLSAVGVLMVAWVCALQVLTDAPTGVTYFVGAFLVVTYFSSALRGSLATTTVTLVAMGAVFVAAMTQDSVLVAPIRRDAAMTMVIFVIFGLLVTHRDDHTSRRLFVSGLRTEALEARREIRLTDLASLNERLTLDATIDPLTRVPNRRALEAATQVWLQEPEGMRGALIIDLDHFKDYNDSYGHAAGDQCLQQVAGVMADSVRQVDALLSRYGGEEFVVLLERVSLDQTEAIAERLRAAVMALQIPAPDGSVVTVSVGGAWASHQEHAGGSELMAAADEALYAAKASGRNMVVCGGTTPHPRLRASGGSGDVRNAQEAAIAEGVRAGDTLGARRG